MKRSIETKIKLNILIISLLIVLACGGMFLYFTSSWKEIHVKKKTIEEYNSELTQIKELIYSVNEAQTAVNLFVITKRRGHLQQFQKQAKEIALCIDSLKANQQDLGVDTLLTEIARLLEQKEQSIIRLNRQYKHRNTIDTLSHTLSVLSSHIQNSKPDSITTTRIVSAQKEGEKEEPPKKGFWKRVTGIFSSSKKENETEPTPKEIVETRIIDRRDSLPVGQIVSQTRVNYDEHLSSIGSQFNSVVLADQRITIRISELLTQLYDRTILARMQEINRDEALLRKNNLRALVIGGIALFLILILIILIVHNVNKGYSARKALERANERTRQLMESRHKLLLSVSHDVKTPLNSILGYTELYKREGLLTEHEVVPITNSGQHILALLNNLLEFSGLEKGSIMLLPRNFSPHNLCTELCEMFTLLARKKSLNFTCREYFEPNLILYSDCLKIKQILTNILSNAIKYTMEGSITLEMTCQKEELEIQVTDTGAGVPADKQEDLFKPFSRVEENCMLDEGSGFGLYVVKGLVTLFDGTIDFQSQQGTGTQVTIQLPVLPGKEQKSDETPKKIVLVDDDEVFLDMLSRLCIQLGHEVIVCRDRGEFKKMIQGIDSCHCVLTDMEMENFTGKEVLKKIREKNEEIPVILVTGRTDYNPATAFSEGFTDYLLKPVTLFGLHALIGGKMNRDAENGADVNNLAALLENDPAAIQEVMARFLMATIDHLVLLKKAIREKSFEEAQRLCHKMLPMCQQTGAPDEIIQTLQKMDSMRGEYCTGDHCIWKELDTLSGNMEAFLTEIQEKFPAC